MSQRRMTFLTDKAIGADVVELQSSGAWNLSFWIIGFLGLWRSWVLLWMEEKGLVVEDMIQIAIYKNKKIKK